MGWLPFLPCLNLSSIISSSPLSLQASIRFRPPPETRHPLTSDSIMGGCASKPKELDAPAASPLSSNNPQPGSTAQVTGGESQIEKVEPETEKEAAQPSSSDDVFAKTDAPKEEDVKVTDETDEDKAEAATKEPIKEAETAEHKPNDAPPSKEEVKSEVPVVAP